MQCDEKVKKNGKSPSEAKFWESTFTACASGGGQVSGIHPQAAWLNLPSGHRRSQGVQWVQVHPQGEKKIGGGG